MGYFKDDFLIAIKIVSYIVIGFIFHDSSEVLDSVYFISNYSEMKHFSISIHIELEGLQICVNK